MGMFFNVHMNVYTNMNMIISTGCAKTPVFKNKS